MNTEITTFEITKAERRKLLYNVSRYNYQFIMASCISFGIGFLLSLIGEVAQFSNANTKVVFDASLLSALVIGAVFMAIALVQVLLCWVPKANEKAILQFDPATQTIEISVGHKKRKLGIHSVTVITSDNLIIFHGLIRQVMLPLSCFDPNKLISFLPKTVK